MEGLSEVELQDQEDFLSSDEYECASPDDISLPPLAETPESNMVQSDLEEGHCFSSRSAHSNQHNHQSHSHLEYIGNGAVQEQRALSQAKCCPTPPGSRQSRSVRRQVTLKDNTILLFGAHSINRIRISLHSLTFELFIMPNFSRLCSHVATSVVLLKTNTDLESEALKGKWGHAALFRSLFLFCVL